MKEFSKVYNPIEVETPIYELWGKNGYFYVKNENVSKKYVIVIPPPNITGFLHMGHALNNTIQDILIRWKRMEGYTALWVPGTDHAGIATQNVVERELMKKGLRRQDVGREKFIEEVWKWKEKYGSRIIYQLKKLGASCDWTRLRFTMDDMLSKAVKEAFVRLYRKGLIYKGKRIIHWCPRCTTALSDEEVEYRDENSYLYYIKYPLVDGGYIEVATTRPETMLGDTAVSVHPEDKRYKNLVGKEVKLPFVNRIIPIISDRRVEREFGTGAVKVTPSHDPADFEIGIEHNLPFITVMTPEGIMNENAGKFKGMDRFECREKIVEELKNLGLLSKIEDYTHRVGHCYRCDTVIEPYLSSQWFVKMKPLAIPAIRVAEEGELKFYPERWKKVYLYWLYNIKDWCISRQIWWGHRIPVWYCSNEECPPIVEIETPRKCPFCGSKELKQEEDVLDTWFSSWLWPFSVFGWPEKTKDLEVFYPTDTLITAQEILFFWVARMVMAGLEFMGEIPFKNIYIHGTVRDKTGRKMSKSLGNVIDPVEIIENYGADSLRFSLISMTAFGQDVFLSPTFYLKGRNFMNKIWNASRLIFSLINQIDFEKEKSYKIENLKFPERWILTIIDEMIEKITVSLNEFRFNEAINTLYNFFWHYFCDWYLEIIKLYQEDTDYMKNEAIYVLFEVYIKILKLLHPFIPFITEKLWQFLKEYKIVEDESISISPWPEKEKFKDEKAQKNMEDMMEIITEIREIKTRFKVPVSRKINCYVDREIGEFEEVMIKKLSGVGEILPFEKFGKGKNVIIRNLMQCRLGVSLEGIINFSEEIEKLKKEEEKLKGILYKVKMRLENKEFINKAPENIVEKEKNKKEEIEKKIENIKKDIEFLEKGERK